MPAPIHQHSGRSTGRFVAVDCGALPEDLIESELFGFKRGAFTSALADKAGLFEEANGGTLFLDEIANTSRRFQAKLLARAPGAADPASRRHAFRQLDIRVIAATNCDLRALVAPRRLPRRPLLPTQRLLPFGSAAEKQTGRHSAARGRHAQRAQADHAGSDLRSSSSTTFPGNVRELENIIESAVYTATGETIEECHIVLSGRTVTAGVIDILTWKTSGTRSHALRGSSDHAHPRGKCRPARACSSRTAAIATRPAVQPAGLRLQEVHGLPAPASLQYGLPAIPAEAEVNEEGGRRANGQ